jgi:hypothetical protein
MGQPDAAVSNRRDSICDIVCNLSIREDRPTRIGAFPGSIQTPFNSALFFAHLSSYLLHLKAPVFS